MGFPVACFCGLMSDTNTGGLPGEAEGDNGKELGAPGCTKRWSLQGVRSGWEAGLMQTAAGVRIIVQRGMERQEDNENHPPASQLCVATGGKRGPW